MQATFDHIDLKPPGPGRWSVPAVLATAVHLLLIAALTWGVGWKQEAQPVTFDAELWSAVAQQAAPREVAPPPPPPPPPQPRAEPQVKPTVPPKVQPKPEPKPPEPKAAPAPPDTRAADIAVAQAKKKKEEADKREAAKKAAAEEKAAEEKADKLEKEKKAKEAVKEKEQAAKKEAENSKLKANQKALDDKAKQLTDDKQQKASDQKAEAAAAKARDEQMRRIMGQADATGDDKAKGSSQKDSGPSAGYAGRVKARIKPNVLLTEDIAGNPKAEVDITTAPDGTIISRRLSRSSGVPAWDRAALAAIDRTGVLPRDTDGRVPSPMTIVLSPRE